MSITTGGKLRFDSSVDPTKTVTFTGNNAGVLQLSSPGIFAAAISGFNSTDYIDLLNTNATGFSYSGTTTYGTLTVTGPSGTVASLNFLGNYNNSSFALLSDGSGGTFVV